MNNVIFTNNAIRRMKQYGLSEAQVLDVYNTGVLDKWKNFNVSAKKYSGYEIRVFWNRNQRGKVLIVSVNKRTRR